MSFSVFASAVATFIEADKVSNASFEAAEEAQASADRARARSTEAWAKADAIFEQLVKRGTFDYALETSTFVEAVAHARLTILLSFFLRELVIPAGAEAPVGVPMGYPVNVHATPAGMNWCNVHQFVPLVANIAEATAGIPWCAETIEAVQETAQKILGEAWFNALRQEHRELLTPIAGEYQCIPPAIRGRARIALAGQQ